MPTFHLQLLQAVLATQQALASVPAASVQLDRVDPVPTEEGKAISIELGDTRSEGVHGTEGEWDILKLRVEIVLAFHSRGAPHTQHADPVIAESNAALMADPSLGGLALRLGFISSRPRRAPGEGTVGIFDLTYEATVLVSERTLALWTH